MRRPILAALPFLAASLAGCHSMGWGVDAGVGAAHTGEFSGYRADYNEVNAALLDRPLGSLDTPRGLQVGGRMTGGFGNLTLGAGLDVARLSARTSALATDGTRRDMKLTVSDIFPEIEVGIRNSPRLIGGMIIRSTRLLAVRSDAAGTSTDGDAAQCTQTDTSAAYCTLGTFEGFGYPYYAGVSWDVPVGRRLSPRLVVTKVFQNEAYDASQLNGTTRTADSDLTHAYTERQGPLRYTAYFPTRVKAGERPGNASAVLSGWRVALTLQLHDRTVFN